MQHLLGPRLRSETPLVSFEFFPPRTAEGGQQLDRTVDRVARIAPDFVSVTYGAGGSGADRRGASLAALRRMVEAGLKTVAHLTCVGQSCDELALTVRAFGDLGISTVLALRGDAPRGEVFDPTTQDVARALDLMGIVREQGDFEVGVAAFPYGHPDAIDIEVDTQVLAAKQSAGATFAITQMFFEVEAYLTLVRRLRAGGVTLPILAGLMPPTRLGQRERLEQFAGAALPARLAEQLDLCASDDEVREVGVAWIVEMGHWLLAEGVPGLHFYTLNRSSATLEAAELLGLGAPRPV